MPGWTCGQQTSVLHHALQYVPPFTSQSPLHLQKEASALDVHLGVGLERAQQVTETNH